MAVLNLNTLRHGKAVSRHVDVDCPELDGEVRLRRLDLKLKMAVHKKWKDVRKDKDGQPRNDEDLADFYVWLLSLSIIDDKDPPQAYLSSDEGRKEIALWDAPVIFRLGDQAMVVNGFGESRDTSKKKISSRGTSTTKATDSSSASVSPPAAST